MERHHAADVRRLRDDIDLGLLMAERLAHMGETGSAVRLVDELRTMAVDTLDPVPQRVPEPVAQRSAAAGRRLRRAIAIGTAAAALGIGSAAALVTPQDTSEPQPVRKEAPSSVGRVAPSGGNDVQMDSGIPPAAAESEAAQFAPEAADGGQISTATTDTPSGDDARDPDDGDGLDLRNDLQKHLPDPVLEEPQPIVTP